MRTDLALAALASAAVPGMKPVAVAGMGVEPGEETELQQAVVEDATGRRWLVRSPLSAVTGARLRRNDELVRQLSRHVPFKVPAPVGYAAVGQEGHAAVYPHVEGSTLDFAQLPPGTGLAHAVGRALAAVHNIPVAVFEQQDVPSFDASGCRQRLISEVDRAAESGRVPTRLLARWEEAFDAAPLWQFASTPVHGAFRGGTVVVAFADDTADSGRVVAVTDWDEAMVGDPAADLADLYSRASPEAWDAVLDSYALARAQRPDPYLHARARLLAETRRLRGLAHHVSVGEEDAARRVVEALRRMDRLTEDEDSLVPVTARGAGTAAVTTGGHASSAASDPEDAGPSADDPGMDGPEPQHLDGSVGDDSVETQTAAEVESEVEAEPEVVESTGDDDVDSTDDEDDALDDPGLDDAAQPDPFLDDGDPHPHPDDRSCEPDTDITAEVPVPEPQRIQQEPQDDCSPGAEDGPRPDADEDDSTPGAEDGSTPKADERSSGEELLDDDTRLHDLYGMPPEEDPRS